MTAARAMARANLDGANTARLVTAGTLAATLAAEPFDAFEDAIERARADLLELAVLRAELARVRARERR